MPSGRYEPKKQTGKHPENCDETNGLQIIEPTENGPGTVHYGRSPTYARLICIWAQQDYRQPWRGCHACANQRAVQPCSVDSVAQDNERWNTEDQRGGIRAK